MKNNSHIITIVVCTVCFLSIIGVCTEAACAFWKIPDMSGALSGGFTHAVDTLVGALLTLLVSTRSQEGRTGGGDPGNTDLGTPANPIAVKAKEPLPVTEIPPSPPTP